MSPTTHRQVVLISLGLSPQNVKKRHKVRGFCAQFVRNFPTNTRKLEFASRIQRREEAANSGSRSQVGNERAPDSRESVTVRAHTPSLAGFCFQILHQPLKRSLVRVVVFPVAKVGDEVLAYLAG
jgi:hypothetical protein